MVFYRSVVGSACVKRRTKNNFNYICQECGEAYHIPDVSEKIDKIIKKFKESTLLVHPVAAGELCLGEVAV
jgi:hypothetical protein